MRNSIIDIILNFDNGIEDGVHERVCKNNEYKEASDKSYEEYKKFMETLNNEQKKRFDNFVNLHTNERCVSNDLYFKEGVKAGMNLAVECFCDDIF